MVDLNELCPERSVEGEECGMDAGRPVTEGTCQTMGRDLFCLPLEGIEEETTKSEETNKDADTDKKAAPPVEPRFSVNIPTVNLTSVQVSTGRDYQYIDIPWLADYLTGVYKYAVFFASILAAVMLMIGGIQWLTAAGDSGRVGAAQKRIANATVGLVLILGSYLVLSTINPDLVALKPLRIKSVPEDPAEFDLFTSTIDTGSPSDNPTPSSPNNNPTSAGAIGSGRGTYQRQYFPGGCPIQPMEHPLPGSHRTRANELAFGPVETDERTIEFINEIMPHITASTNSEQLAQLEEAAWSCGVHFGSCGRLASSLAMLALDGPSAACLGRDRDGFKMGCMDRYNSRTEDIGHVSQAQRELAHGRWCQQRDARPDCIPDKNQAIRSLYDTYRAANREYPDFLTERLRPGDIVTFYNANTDPYGSHRVVFMGWAGGDHRSGRAQFLNGAINRVPYSTDTCISSGCTNPAPITKIERLMD
ncbi:pilin [Patescibacteria group bacterium]|nr:pilin [Patescibacteria group bacterium]